MLNAADDPETQRLAQAAAQAYSRGDRVAAANFARLLLVRRPGDANARQLLGFLALEAGDAAAARTHLEAADAAAPDQPQISNGLGVALRLLGDLEAARRRFARAGELGLIDGWRNLGGIEALMGDKAASITAYEQALKLDPRDALAHAALAHAFETGHDPARAKRHAEAALRADPGNSVARVALARALMREKDFAGAEAAAAPTAASTRASRNDRAIAWGVIGEARDLRGDARSAFQAFTAANRLLLQEHAALLEAADRLYHPVGVRSMTQFVAQTDVATWRAPGAFTTPAPVFLVGFPRSGTTLLDQILSSHSRIVCLEEKEHFSNALWRLFKQPEKLAAMGALTDAEIDTVRQGYWALVRADTRLAADALVIDKLPLNIVVLPLIRAVFPDAKVIFALRDPRDVVLSCYQQRFGMNAAMAQFLELRSAAAYYDIVMRLFELCRERLGLALHQVRYEDVVADLEGAARALTGFLGVDYEERMLDFRATALKRSVNTPSARQVIQPLYTRSIGRWRRYAEDMAPVLPTLRAWAERFGYQP